jgi:hypothetical protein
MVREDRIMLIEQGLPFLKATIGFVSVFLLLKLLLLLLGWVARHEEAIGDLLLGLENVVMHKSGR